MPRIPTVPDRDAGVVGRLVYRAARRMYGSVPEPFAVARHHRGVFWASMVAELGWLRAARRLPASVRELAVYRTATVVGCSWCVDFGTMLQRLDGLDTDRLAHIGEYATSPLYTDDERRAIAYADAMTAQPMTVTDEQVRDLVDAFGKDGVVELTTMIAVENQRARANHALGITDQGFDAACRVRLAEPSGAGKRPSDVG